MLLILSFGLVIGESRDHFGFEFGYAVLNKCKCCGGNKKNRCYGIGEALLLDGECTCSQCAQAQYASEAEKIFAAFFEMLCFFHESPFRY